MYVELSTNECAAELMQRCDYSYDAAHAIAETLEQWESDSGEPLQFDAIAIRCDWAEYDSALAVWDDYNPSYSEPPTDDEILDWLRGETTVIALESGGLVMLQF